MKAFSCALMAVAVTAAVSVTAAPVPAAPLVAKSDPASTTAPVDPESLALAHQIIDIAFPPEKRAQMWDSVLDTIVEQSRANVLSATPDADKDKELSAVVDASTDRMIAQMKTVMNASIPDYFESFARAYARNFSRDDLKAILAFVQTPAGSHYFARAPGMLKDPDVQAAGRRTTERLFEQAPELQKQLRHDVQAYVARKRGQQKAGATPGV